MANYPKIHQLKDIINSYKRSYYFQGLDENGEPIYDYNVEIPSLRLIGTEKIHGTNSGICFDYEENTITTLSKNNKLYIWNIINNTTKRSQDNAGFSNWIDQRFNQILYMRKILLYKFPNAKSITIFGEFAGQGVQKGVAVSSLPKFWYLFDVKIVTQDDKIIWDLDLLDSLNIDFFRKIDIYTSAYFGTWYIHLDMMNDLKLQNGLNKIQEWVDSIENNSSVGYKLAEKKGIELKNTIGEGIVWIGYDKLHNILRAKTKGDKHSKGSKTKKFKVSLEPTQVENINDFINQVCNEDRLYQGLQEVFGIDNVNNKMLDRKLIGKYIGWVMKDINDECQEEISSLVKKGVSWKQATPFLLNRIKAYFFEVEKEA